MRQFITHTHTHRVVHSIGARTLSQTNDAEESSPTRHSSSSSRAYTSLARCVTRVLTDVLCLDLESIVRMVSCRVVCVCESVRGRLEVRTISQLRRKGRHSQTRRHRSIDRNHQQRSIKTHTNDVDIDSTYVWYGMCRENDLYRICE